MKKYFWLFFFYGCNQNLKLPKWIYHNYQTCELKLSENLLELPQDLVLNLNRYDLPRYDAFNSFRPWIVTKDLQTMELGKELLDPTKLGQISIQVTAWESEGLYLNWSWQEPQNAVYEEYVGHFNITPQTHRYDIYRFDPQIAEYTNLTHLQEVSFYNSVAIKWQDNLIFHALVGNQMKLFKMDQQGLNKQLFSNNSGYIYGFSVSPDGTKYAFHSNYQVYIGDFESQQEILVSTPCAFNFGPLWSPDSSKIAFYCGASSISPDIYISDSNGQNVRFLASRNGYNGTVPFISGYDHHGGGTDRIEWADSESIIYGAKIQNSVELMRIFLDGSKEQLTFSLSGDTNTNPAILKDQKWLLYNHNQNANLMNLETLEIQKITNLDANCNSRRGIWK